VIPTLQEKNQLYKLCLQQVASILDKETDSIAILASVVCILKTNLPYAYWVGFYRVDPQKSGELVIGPYQGTFGCLRIPFGRGVCGLCAEKELPVIVPNVAEFIDHIACDSRAASEIVIPVYNNAGRLYAVLDLDSTEFEAFQDEDCEGLESITDSIKMKLS
jgi:L-methionine (R)-S-oxide reductase